LGHFAFDLFCLTVIGFNSKEKALGEPYEESVHYWVTDVLISDGLPTVYSCLTDAFCKENIV